MLTDLEKLVLICGCAGLLGIAFLTSYLVWQCRRGLNKTLKKRQRMNDGIKKYNDQNSFKLSFIDVEETRPPSAMTRSLSPKGLKSSAEFDNRLTSVKSDSSSACSNMDSLTGIPLPSTTDTKIRESETTLSRSNLGNVALTLQFKDKTYGNGKIIPQLQINLKEASDLPTRSYGGRCNPYFIISLYDAKVFKKNERGRVDALPVLQFRSKVVKKSINPVYNESFLFPMKIHSEKKCVLFIEAWDKDKLTNDTILGEAHYILKNIKKFLIKEPIKEVDISLTLGEAKYNNGFLLLGLCYFPTAERMTVAVFKAINLMRMKETNANVDYYVQVIAMYAGRIFEERNTSCRPASKLLVFNEILMFDVPFSKIDDMVLIFAVHSRVRSKLNEGKNLIAKSRNSCLGNVVIGGSSKKPSVVDHWNALRNSPRRQVVQWHELR